MKKLPNKIIYSAHDLIHFQESPYFVWMDRYNLENPGKLIPDKTGEELQLFIDKGNEHEEKMLNNFIETGYNPVVIKDPVRNPNATKETLSAVDLPSAFRVW